MFQKNHACFSALKFLIFVIVILITVIKFSAIAAPLRLYFRNTSNVFSLLILDSKMCNHPSNCNEICCVLLL